MKKRDVFRRNLIVVGVGPHYQKRYHSILEELECNILLTIDLKSEQQSIEQFFFDKGVKPVESIYLDEEYRNSLSPELIDSLIPESVPLKGVDLVLICTEPKVKKSYSLWAINHGFDIFMDKPVCAFTSLEEAEYLFSDYLQILENSEKGGVDVFVSCERRSHPGYRWLKDEIYSRMNRTSAHISSIDIHFAGGIMNLPDEFISRENHPFKYGYGILMHSGYHYLDVLSTFLDMNHLVDESTPSYQLSTHSSHVNGMGETDLIVSGMQKRGEISTLFSLKLLGTSLCLRKGSAYTPHLEGKVRQEKVTIHLGFDCSIHIESLPLKKFDDTVGDHFDITVLTKGDVKRYSFGGGPSLNKSARGEQLRAVLLGATIPSTLASHKNTMWWLEKIYESIHKSQLDALLRS